MRTLSLLLFVLVLPLQIEAQYFNYLYDGDSTADMGRDIVLNPDGTLFILSTGGYSPYRCLLSAHLLSADGSQILDQHVFSSAHYDYFLELAGRTKKVDGGYVSPTVLGAPTSNPDFTASAAAGIIKFDEQGDTVFLRSYTDTNKNWDKAWDCVRMPDGGYMLGGARHRISASDTTPAVLWRTDSMGNLLWEREYQWSYVQNYYCSVSSIEVLDTDKLLVGMTTTMIVWLNANWFYYRSIPHFLVLDTLGSIIRDTLYSADYAGGGTIFTDKAGGYFHYGTLDSLLDPTYPDEVANFPCYVAHLDTNFNVEWLTTFYTPIGVSKDIWSVTPLHDSGYMVMGSYYDYPSYAFGWVAKLDKHGTILWDNVYQDYPYAHAYLTDAIKTTDHNLILTGGAKDPSLPTWRWDDMWILGLDSNGCEITGCTPTPTSVRNMPVSRTQGHILLYPNPSRDDITIEAKEEGSLHIYDLRGREVGSYAAGKGSTHIRLPEGMPRGIYIAKFVGKNGDSEVLRLVKD